jgi:translocation and assembly module TamA
MDRDEFRSGARDRERLERAFDALGLVLVLLLEVFGLLALAIAVVPCGTALAATADTTAVAPADTAAMSAAAPPAQAAPPAKRASIKVKVEVLGVTGVLRKNVLASLSIAHKKDRKNATEGELRHLHSRADEEIGRALQPFGYYRPFIHSELTTGKRWVARYQIEPGPPLLADSVLVQVTGDGAADPKFQRLVQDFPVKKGSVLLHQAYEQGKLSLETYAAEGGYLDADFNESRIEVDLARYAATVVVRYDSGPKHFFGPVAFDHAVIDRSMLERFPTFRSGDVFNFRKLQDLQSSLSNTGYFTRVEVEPGEERMGHRQVPIEVGLAPAKKLRFTGGVGYGTDDGARVRGLIEFRRINTQGHRAQLNLQYGQRDKRAELQYFIPWPNPRTDVATLSTGYLDITTQTSTSKIEYGGGSLSRLLGQWRVIPALNYRRERFTVGVDHGTVRTLVPEGTWSRTRTDDELLTRNGDRVSLNVRGAAEGFVSDVSFAQTRVEGKLVHGFPGRNRGIVRIEAGATGTSDFRELPASFRFFAGGATSVRGYGYNSIGPRDELDHVIGGPYLLVGSLEADHRFLPRWGLAAFFDMGNALNNFGDPLKRGVGTGLRWISPAGLVRLDFAWGLDRAGTPFNVHLTVGPEL